MIKIGRITLALTIIAIGVIGLISIVDSTFTKILSMYWPVIFVVFGIEIIVTSFFKKEKRLSISSFFCALLLAFISSYYFDVQTFDWSYIWQFDSILSDNVTQQINLKKAVENKSTLYINISSGELEIVESNDEYIHLNGYAITPTNQLEEIAIEGTVQRWEITPSYRTQVHGKLAVPAAITEVIFTSENGSLKVNDWENAISFDVTTMNGIIEMLSGKQAVVGTENGSVLVKNIEQVKISNANGSVSVMGEKTRVVTVTGKQSRVSLETPNIQQADIQTINGNIMIEVENDPTITFNTTNGMVSIFEKQMEKEGKYRGGTIGADIEVQTTNGAIKISQIKEVGN